MVAGIAVPDIFLILEIRIALIPIDRPDIPEVPARVGKRGLRHHLGGRFARHNGIPRWTRLVADTVAFSGCLHVPEVSRIIARITIGIHADHPADIGGICSHHSCRIGVGDRAVQPVPPEHSADVIVPVHITGSVTIRYRRRIVVVTHQATDIVGITGYITRSVAPAYAAA